MKKRCLNPICICMCSDEFCCVECRQLGDDPVPGTPCDCNHIECASEEVLLDEPEEALNT
jgi:hypothetical protein